MGLMERLRNFFYAPLVAATPAFITPSFVRSDVIQTTEGFEVDGDYWKSLHLTQLGGVQAMSLHLKEGADGLLVMSKSAPVALSPTHHCDYCGCPDWFTNGTCEHCGAPAPPEA